MISKWYQSDKPVGRPDRQDKGWPYVVRVEDCVTWRHLSLQGT